MFLAGEYAGVGGVGSAAATCASRDSPDEYGLMDPPFMERGPAGREVKDECDVIGLRASNEEDLLS